MITVEQILEDCERELQIARENGDTRKIELLLKCKERFSDGKGFNRKTVSDDTLFLAACFDYPVDKIIKIREFLEDSFKVKGILYVLDRDGREYPEEVWLDPEMEGYYQFLPHGPVCKIAVVNKYFSQTYILCDGEWVYDGSLQKKFEDTGYDCVDLRCEVPGRRENKV